MEYSQFLPFIYDYLPDEFKDNEGFSEYFLADGTLESYASLIMMMLPEPRIDYYSSPDFAKIKAGVLGQTN